MWQWEVRGRGKVRGHVTHSAGASPAIEAIAHVASEAGAVPLTLTHILTASMPTAATIVLQTIYFDYPEILRFGDLLKAKTNSVQETS